MRACTFYMSPGGCESALGKGVHVSFADSCQKCLASWLWQVTRFISAVLHIAVNKHHAQILRSQLVLWVPCNFPETEGTCWEVRTSPISAHCWKLPCLDDCAKTGHLKFHSRRGTHPVAAAGL